jgi:ABC-type polar amino acid transport system ATPase subunit
MPREEAESLARDLLKRVRIPEQADKYPAQLSARLSAFLRGR